MPSETKRLRIRSTQGRLTFKAAMISGSVRNPRLLSGENHDPFELASFDGSLMGQLQSVVPALHRID